MSQPPNQPPHDSPARATAQPTRMRRPGERIAPADPGANEPRPATRTTHGAQASAQAIGLHIDELVLDGFSRYDQQRITEALQRELRVLIAERIASGAFSGDMEIPRLNGGSFTVQRGMRPEKIGAEIARAIVGVVRG